MAGPETGTLIAEDPTIFPFLDSTREKDPSTSEELNLMVQNEQLGLVLPEEQNGSDHNLRGLSEQVVLFSAEEHLPFERGKYWRIQRNRHK